METLTSRILSIQVGMPTPLVAAGSANPLEKTVMSGITKKPVLGPVQVTLRNLVGDGQADLKNHGSPDQALLVYASEHYNAWKQELGIPDFSFGAFGENLTVTGQSESTICIGDTFAAGDVVMQVTQPRMPCFKLNRRWNMPDLASRVEETGRGGWYLRILKAGTLEAGMVMTLTERPCPEWTISDTNDVMYGRRRDYASIESLADCPLLSVAWRKHFRKWLEG